MITQNPTKSQTEAARRASCWRPEVWTVTRMEPCHYLLTNSIHPDITFQVWERGEDDYAVRSNHGTVRTLLLGCCGCPDKERALGQGRPCRHEAAVWALQRFLDDERREQDPFAGEALEEGRELTPAEEEALDEEAAREAQDEACREQARIGVLTGTVRDYLEGLGWRWVPTMEIGKGTTVHLRASELPSTA